MLLLPPVSASASSPGTALAGEAATLFGSGALAPVPSAFPASSAGAAASVTSAWVAASSSP